MRFAQRYWLVAALFILFAAAGALIYRQPPSASENLFVVTPTPVVLEQAEVIAQGVRVSWLKSQPGLHPINGYIVERSRDGRAFERIARTEAVFLEYVDADGRAGDTYRIFAEDSGHPAGRSPASDLVIATTPKPGTTVIRAPASVATHVLGASSTQIDLLQKLIAQTFTDVDTALSRNNLSAAQEHLHNLHMYQRQILSLWPQLETAQKTSLAQVCANQAELFEANLHRLSEDSQFDGMLVLAGCSVMQDGAA